jgi:cysteine-rich repeat protein
MGTNKNIGILFLVVMQCVLNACDQEKGNTLGRGLLAPSVPYREATDNIPAFTPRILNNESNEKDNEEEAADQKKILRQSEKEHIENNPFRNIPKPPPPPLPPPFEDDGFLDGPFGGIGVIYSLCGNGIVEPKEECDDGNGNNLDGCNVLCQFPVCGNGLLEKFEECDNNGLGGNSGCSLDCKYQRCGNRIVETGEECDDGNRVSGDGCSPCCQFEESCATK